MRIKLIVTKKALCLLFRYYLIAITDIHCRPYMQAMQLYINIHVITQAILAFSLAAAYHLLEDRCMIDIIITRIFPKSVF